MFDAHAGMCDMTILDCEHSNGLRAFSFQRDHLYCATVHIILGEGQNKMLAATGYLYSVAYSWFY